MNKKGKNMDTKILLRADGEIDLVEAEYNTAEINAPSDDYRELTLEELVDHYENRIARIKKEWKQTVVKGEWKYKGEF